MVGGLGVEELYAEHVMKQPGGGVADQLNVATHWHETVELGTGVVAYCMEAQLATHF